MTLQKRKLLSEHHLAAFSMFTALFLELFSNTFYLLKGAAVASVLVLVEFEPQLIVCRNPHKLDASGICRGKGREYLSSNSSILGEGINVTLSNCCPNVAA